MNGLSVRGLLAWMALATSSLPVPLSPTTRMVEREGAAWAMRLKTCCMRGLLPTISVKRAWSRSAVRSWRFSSCSRRCLSAVAQDVQQLLVLEGLGHVVEGALLHGRERRLHRGEGGDHQHHQLGVELLQLLQHLDAAHLGQHHVHDGGVEGVLAGQGQALLAVGGQRDPVAGLAQQRAQHVAHDLLVVDDEDGSRLIVVRGRRVRAPAAGQGDLERGALAGQRCPRRWRRRAPARCRRRRPGPGRCRGRCPWW